MMMRILWLIVTLIVISPSAVRVLNATMPRLMLIQIPALLSLGYISSYFIKSQFVLLNYRGIAGLIFFIGSLLFWMIPHSLDMVVSSASANQLMHINLLFAGFVLAKSLPQMEFITKVTFIIYLLVMLFSLAFVYVNANILFCSVFSIEQQHMVGRYLFWESGVFFAALIYTTILS